MLVPVSRSSFGAELMNIRPLNRAGSTGAEVNVIACPFRAIGGPAISVPTLIRH